MTIVLGGYDLEYLRMKSWAELTWNKRETDGTHTALAIVYISFNPLRISAKRFKREPS